MPKRNWHGYQPKGKATLCLRIKKTVLASFRQFVGKQEEGLRKGLLSFYIEQAMISYMGDAAAGRTHTKRNPTSKAWLLRNQILDYIMNNFTHGEKPYSVGRTVLEKAIHGVKGTDPRTVDNAMYVLQLNGLIKRIDRQDTESDSSVMWEIV